MENQSSTKVETGGTIQKDSPVLTLQHNLIRRRFSLKEGEHAEILDWIKYYGKAYRDLIEKYPDLEAAWENTKEGSKEQESILDYVYSQLVPKDNQDENTLNQSKAA